MSMTDDQLRAIEARAEAYNTKLFPTLHDLSDFNYHARTDIPALVAEVRRLQREIDRLNAEDGA